MITITRKTARLVRKVFRLALSVGNRDHAPPLVLQAGADGVHFRAVATTAAADFVVPGERPEETIAIPYGLLADCEGSQDEPVQIDRMGDGRIVAGWHDQSVPIVKQYDGIEPDEVLAKYPAFPTDVRENGPETLPALRDAMDIADRDPGRYATDHIRLRGSDDSIAATDGRHMLVQSGYDLPTDDDLLIPRTTVFGCRELPTDESVLIGIADEWVAIRVGAWTFQFKTNTDGRFPQVDDHIAKAETASTRMTIGETDATFLAKALSRLPCEDETNKPITIDLNGSVAVRAKGENNGVTEILLGQSSRDGEALRLNTNRHYLAHAIKLGFRDVHIFRPDTPLLCCDERRQYVWAPLDPESAIKPTDRAVRIESPTVASQAGHNSSQFTRRIPTTMKRSPKSATEKKSATENRTSASPSAGVSTNQAAGNGSPRTDDTIAPEDNSLDQAIALRDTLRSAARQASEIVGTLKAERRKSMKVRATLASLRKLPVIDA